VGSFPVPSVDCVLEGAEEAPGEIAKAATSPAAGPIIAGLYVALDCEPLTALLAGSSANTAHNLSEAESNPCFNFVSAEAEGLLGDIAGFIIGGGVNAGLRAGGDAAGMSPIGERIVHIWADGAGALAAAAHSIGEH
jgi:hypothetical protein